MDCDDPTEICDKFNRECYPENGNCSENGVCPLFDGSTNEVAETLCDSISGYCRLKARKKYAVYLRQYLAYLAERRGSSPLGHDETSA